MKRNKKGQFAKARKIGTVDIILLIAFWSVIIVVMEKVKWEAAKALSTTSIIIISIAYLAIIVSEYLKYSAVRHIRKLFGSKNGDKK